MPLLTEQKKSKISSIFSGQVSMDKVLKSGQSFLQKETGNERQDPIDSIFAGIYRAKTEDDKIKEKQSTSPIAQETGSIFTGIKQAMSDIRKTLLPTRSEDLSMLQEEAQQTFTPQEAQRRLVEQEQRQGMVSPLMFRPVETGEDFEKFLGEKRFDVLGAVGSLKRVGGEVVRKAGEYVVKRIDFNRREISKEEITHHIGFLKSLIKKNKEVYIPHLIKDIKDPKRSYNLEYNKESLAKSRMEISKKYPEEIKDFEVSLKMLEKEGKVTEKTHQYLKGTGYLERDETPAKLAKDELFEKSDLGKAKDWLWHWVHSLEGRNLSSQMTNPSKAVIRGLDKPEYKSSKPITVYRATYKGDLANTRYSAWTRKYGVAQDFLLTREAEGRLGRKIISKKVTPNEVFVEVNKLPKRLRPVLEEGGSESEVILKPVIKSIFKETEKAPKLFQGLKNLSTKLLEKFKGMSEEINQQQFQEVLNRAEKEGIRKADKELITRLAREQIEVSEKGQFKNKYKPGRIDLIRGEEIIEQQRIPSIGILTKDGRLRAIDDIEIEKILDKEEIFLGSPYTAPDHITVLSYLEERNHLSSSKNLSKLIKENKDEYYKDSTLRFEKKFGVYNFRTSKYDLKATEKLATEIVYGDNAQIVYVINGNASIMPFSKEYKPQIELFAKEMILGGANPEMPIVGAELALSSFEAPFQGKKIGILGDFFSETSRNKINLITLAKDVETQLVPLTPIPVKSPRWSSVGEDFIGDGKYGEIVYQSPIKTSAGEVHFPISYERNNVFGKVEQDFSNYFFHIRYEDMADGKTRKIIETQSDLMQKRTFEAERGLSIYNGKKLTKQEIETREQGLKNLSAYESNDPLAQLRTFREEVKRAAKDGKDTILIPSGDTAMKIEGLGASKRWTDKDGIQLLTAELKTGKEIRVAGTDGENWIITDVLGDGKFKAVPKGRLMNKEDFIKYGGENPIELNGQYISKNDTTIETHDISGKVDTKHFVYKLNEEAIPREARKMGLQVKGKIKEGQGEYWKIKVPKERGKLPVSAFGKTDIGTMLGVGGSLAGAAVAAPFLGKKNEFDIEGNKVVEIKDRGVSVNTQTDAKALGAVLFGELSNKGDQKEEVRQILNTILNRAREFKKAGKEKSIRGILKEKNAYQAFGDQEYKKYLSGDLDEPSQKKVKIVDEVLQELFSGNFKDNTDNSFYYHHDDKTGKLILDKYRPLFK